MSFGVFSVNVICLLNCGVQMGNFYYDIGEGSISFYYCENGGDLVWELGSGYFGCCICDGKFDFECFVVQVFDLQVKMIEIKFSQGVKLGYGGILFKYKVIFEIVVICGVLMGEDCVLLLCYSVFFMLIELMQFIVQLCELFGGKLVGFKFCLGYLWEFMGIVKVMLEIGIFFDFIVVDGKEGGIGVVLLEFIDYIGVLLCEGLLFVYNILVGFNLCDKIKVGVSGKIVSVFDIVSVLVIGVDWVNLVCGFMFVIGCIQLQSCYINKCLIGVVIQDLLCQCVLVVLDKVEWVCNFYCNIFKGLVEMFVVVGLEYFLQFEVKYLV